MKGKTQGFPEAGPDTARHSSLLGMGVVVGGLEVGEVVEAGVVVVEVVDEDC